MTTVIEDERRMEQLERTMEVLQRAIRSLPDDSRDHVGNALLNLALGSLVHQYGQRRTAGLLARVVDSLASEMLPTTADCPLDAVRLDA